jgi:hypothetical protein
MIGKGDLIDEARETCNAFDFFAKNGLFIDDASFSCRPVAMNTEAFIHCGGKNRLGRRKYC